MTDIPRKAVARTAKLASLPLSFAGRTVWGLGKRVTGMAADVVSAQIAERTAEQLGPDWRSLFKEFDDHPAAAASIGQVHRAEWKVPRRKAGIPVAVKVQYPGAGDALVADLAQLGRFAALFNVIQPGLDVKPLVTELRERVVEELDYELEATSQRAFALAYADDEQFFIPKVLAVAPRVIVTEWIEGKPLSSVIGSGTVDERDRAGELMATLHFSAPQRAGMLHADPHPGNFRLLPDGRLGVIDFGAVARLPEGLPAIVGKLARLALAGDADGVMAGLRGEGFIKPGAELDAKAILEYVSPMLEPIAVDEFRFSRAWLRGEAARIASPRSPAYAMGRQLNLPPAYLMIHRVTMGSIGVLCQLEAKAHYRAILQEWLPGFADET